MPLLADAAQLANANPGVSALVGNALGVVLASLAVVRRRWRVEARQVAKEEARAAVADCQAICLTPHPRAPGA